jgi:hypothetical protein
VDKDEDTSEKEEEKKEEGEEEESKDGDEANEAKPLRMELLKQAVSFLLNQQVQMEIPQRLYFLKTNQGLTDEEIQFAMNKARQLAASAAQQSAAKPPVPPGQDVSAEETKDEAATTTSAPEPDAAKEKVEMAAMQEQLQQMKVKTEAGTPASA